MIQHEYEEYLKRVKEEEKQAELKKHDQELLKKYRDRKGRPINITN